MKATSLALAVSAAALAAPLMASPALAEGSHTCFGGSRTPTSEGYDVSGSGCDGVGYVDLQVTIRFGPAAGTYACSWAFPWNSTLAAHGCTLTS